MVAVHLQDLEVLKAAIEECKVAGMMQRELEEAIMLKESMERMLTGLMAAIERQDMKGVKVAIAECGIDMLKTAIEQSRAAGVPKWVLEDAMSERAKVASNLPESERKRLQHSLDSCNDDEKRASYNMAVSMLRDAIRTGGDVPPQFD